MAYTPKNGQGSLFANDYKKEDKHPDWKGTLMGLDGVLYDLAAWRKTGQKGEFLSLSLSPHRERAPQASQPAQDAPQRPTDRPAVAQTAPPDDLPF